MQVISSLLNLNTRYIKDKEIIDIFKGSQSRIRTMALVHEKLYLSKDIAKINFADYIQSLSSNLFQVYKTSPNKINLKVDVKQVQLDLTAAVPCGLIINELIANALKYAFPAKRTGEITVRLLAEKKNGANDNYTLIVSDNGIGLPEDLDFQDTRTLGLRLVNMLVKQLNGSIELTRGKGTLFNISFKG